MYRIGNIQRHINGWCLREHIFGILVDVQVWWKGEYYSRPLPKTIFAKVQELVEERRWNKAAAELCEPRWMPKALGAAETARCNRSRCNSSRTAAESRPSFAH